MKTRGLLGFLLFALLFLAVNDRAYKGYFQNDEMDSLSWTVLGRKTAYLETVLSPRFQPNNFRPVGHFYFREAGLHFGLTFWKYIAVLHLFQLFNVWLVWLLARRLGSPPFAAGAACLLFAFHMALFDVFWKPMYVFDLLCGTFCLLSLLFYTRRRWVLSFIAFWLAYKAEELAVMLPFVLACYEICFAQRKEKLNWKPLVPFFLASLSFGLQGILLNPNHGNDYAFHFTPDALLATGRYYGGLLLLSPWLALLLPIGAVLARSRRAWFGLAMMALFFVPLLFLPGRLFSAYCYVPFTGLAIAFSGLAEAAGPIPVAVFFLIFLPLDAQVFTAQRSITLTVAKGARAWLTTAAAFSGTRPVLDTVIYSGFPPGFGPAGCEAALRYVFHDHYLTVLNIDDRQAPAALQRGHAAVLTWDDGARTLAIVPPAK